MCNMAFPSWARGVQVCSWDALGGAQQAEGAARAGVGLAGGEGMESGFPSALNPRKGPLRAGLPEGDINGCEGIV